MRLSAYRARPAVGVVLVFALLIELLSLVAGDESSPIGAPHLRAQAQIQYTDAIADQQRRVTCTRCHQLPPPDILPKAVWHDFVARMWLRREGLPEPSQRGAAAALRVPDEFQIIGRWYTEHAPETLPAPDLWPTAHVRSPRFAKRKISSSVSSTPAVSNVQFVDLDGDARLEVLATDMRYGAILKMRPYEDRPSVETLGYLSNPAHASVVDLDGDGIKDILVADLGDFLPSDHMKGAVTWLRGRRDGSFVPLEIGGMPRIADVEAADMDGDGRLDLLVAAFGWRKVGQTMLLLNRTTDYAQPSFDVQTIDARAGGIHVIPADLDKDGRMDMIALLSQQHERVIAFYNNGPDAGFSMETLYAAPHPNWGSSGIQLTDLDSDGDDDVLLTHGDTLDDYILKPYHGIMWLENKGGFEMEPHTITSMPGVHRALAAYMDSDGDKDIVAVAMIGFDAGEVSKRLVSVGYLEFVAPGKYMRHALEMGELSHATMDVADYDRDGDMDLAVGGFTFGTGTAPSVEIWENVSGAPVTE